jgi:hypothetical protein|tara:strand:- start:111 stop:494 length:384 start_codon:yes stop_codon:yes gene_type:complete
MVTLTFAVTMRLLYFAVNSVKKGEVHIKQYRTYEGEFPPKLNSVRQHYKNMFEMPILFYLLCVLLLIQNNFNQIDIVFAWGFVIFRILHSISRIPNKDINIRFGLFVGSFIMLAAGWVHYGLKFINC